MKILVTDVKKLLFTAIIFSFIYMLIFFANENLNIINKTINLYITSVLPALFLFILFTELFINLGFETKISRLVILVINKIFKTNYYSSICILFGFLLGYPNAAKYISHLYKTNKLTEKEAKRLCLFTNNANISYIILSIGIGILGNIKLGYILLISHFLSSLIIGYISSFFLNNNIIQHNNQDLNYNNIYFNNSDKFEIFKKSIKNTCITLMYIFSYMIIFSAIPNFLLNICSSLNIAVPSLFKAILIGFFEITSGIYEINILNISLELKLCLISFVISFSSLMIIFQIYTYLNICRVKITELITYKFMHGILSMVLTYIILKLTKIKAVNVFSNIELYTKNNLVSYYLLFYIISIFILFFILYLLKKKRQE